MATRDPKAQWLPIYSTVVEIQNYLLTKNIDWTAVNCGALVEFAFDCPFILDFDSHQATLWDPPGAGEGWGGQCNEPVEWQGCRTSYRWCAQTTGSRAKSLCPSPWRYPQSKAGFSYRRKYTPGVKWTSQVRDAEPAIEESKAKMLSSIGGDDLVQTLMFMTSAATFGNGHSKAAYEKPDNDWLGVEMMKDGEVEEAIRRRIKEGVGFAFAKDGRKDDVEGLGDVASDLAAKHNEQ